MQPLRFNHKVAIISGAGSGLGLLCAQQLAQEGASVVLTDINGDAVAQAAEVINQQGYRAFGVAVDVTNYDQVRHAVDQAKEHFASVDILVNCAGGAPTRILNKPAPFHQRDVDVLDWGIDVNLKGALYFCRAAVEAMIEQQRGVMINLGSIDGVTGSHAVEYSAAKSAMIGMTKSLALVGADHGVRACCVSPGPVLTRPGMSEMKTALGRAAEPQEIVDVILYLCSDQASFITGSHHVLDGGRQCGAR